MMSCKASSATFVPTKPGYGRPRAFTTVRCAASMPAGPQEGITRRSIGALLAAVPLLAISTDASCQLCWRTQQASREPFAKLQNQYASFYEGAARADVQDAIKSADPSMSTGSIPKLGDTSEGGPPGDVGKAISEGARGAEVPDPLKTIQGKSGIPSPDIGNKFGGGPKVPTFGTNPNLAKNSVVEKALTDNSPTVQFNKKQ